MQEFESIEEAKAALEKAKETPITPENSEPLSLRFYNEEDQGPGEGSLSLENISTTLKVFGLPQDIKWDTSHLESIASLQDILPISAIKIGILWNEGPLQSHNAHFCFGF